MTDFLERKAELLRELPQPLEMAGLEMEEAALHGALDACVVGVVGGRETRALDTRLVERDAELVREDFLRRAHAFERVGVDHLVDLRDEELVREHRELHDESL